MNNLKKIDYISKWIKSYVNAMENPAQSLVVGISGGIDSALSSTLSSLTGIKTIAISMPISTSQNPSDLGRLHGKWFCLLYTSPSPRDLSTSRMPSSA